MFDKWLRFLGSEIDTGHTTKVNVIVRSREIKYIRENGKGEVEIHTYDGNMIKCHSSIDVIYNQLSREDR